MLKLLAILYLCTTSLFVFSQQTKVSGRVVDAANGEGIPDVQIRFLNSKIGTLTDSLGFYILETYYATDSISFFMPEFERVVKFVKKETAQVINVSLKESVVDITEVTILPPDEFPSTTLHKKVIANKKINDKEKLLSYEYELYNKLQVDLNNIGEKFENRKIVKRLDLIMNYLDSVDNEKKYLPLLLSESISNFYFRNSPKRKKEVVEATHVTGIENLQLNQFLGEMYLDINIYDNYLNLFKKAFISPVSDYARNYYKFYLEDSMFIDNDWCYKLRFVPKRYGDLTFVGEMWINDTTYAVKSFKANLSPSANINFLQDMYLEHHFDQVQKEVWMLTEEKMILDIKITKGTKLYGFFGRKHGSRKKFVINVDRPLDYYKSNSTVEFADSAKIRDEAYWIAHRHTPLNAQEVGINQMVDSLNNTPFFKFLKNVTYMAATGYYKLGKIEIGDIHSLFSFNPVEKFRTGIALRTSNNFSRIIELGGKLYYGFYDKKFKYGVSTRINITPKKRGLLTLYGSRDIEQIGASPKAATVGSTFGTIFRTGPLNKLTFVDKAGITLEKDFGKDFILYTGLEWKEYTPLGLAIFERKNQWGGIDTIRHVQSAEVTLRLRWCKNEEFIAGAFDRTPLSSKFPVLSLQAIFGVKGVFGSDYSYQKIEFSYSHNRAIGPLGRLRYGFDVGAVFGTVAYPFLKIHEGSQSYWLYTNAFNRLNFYEFISDRYVGAFLEHHWPGFLLDRIPGIKKLKWRFVNTFRITYGAISQKHNDAMLIPNFVKRFGDTPYAEAGIGLENIFKFGRIDLVWRISHLDKGMMPLGVRARLSFSF